MADHINNFQDPLIRPGFNLPLIGALVLLGLPFILLVMVLAKEPVNNVASEASIFKPGAAQVQRP